MKIFGLLKKCCLTYGEILTKKLLMYVFSKILSRSGVIYVLIFKRRRENKKKVKDGNHQHLIIMLNI